MNVLAEARGRQRTLTDQLDGASADRLIGLPSGEEIGAGPVSRPVLTEDHQQPWREHHVAVLVPLALTDVDDHAGAVDILDPEVGYLGEPQPAGVGGHQ